MLLIFIIEPLPGEKSIRESNEHETIKNEMGLTAAAITYRGALRGKLKTMELPSMEYLNPKHKFGKLTVYFGDFTAFDLATTPPTLLRRDFALDDLRELGAKLPPFYFDELGNLRGETDQIIMAGPNNPRPQ